MRRSYGSFFLAAGLGMLALVLALPGLAAAGTDPSGLDVFRRRQLRDIGS